MSEVQVHALRGVDCRVYEGEFVVLLGASGSGKSTLLNIIGGIDVPTAGTVTYKGRDIGAFKERELTNYRRKAVGFVFQFYNLVPDLTAEENIRLAYDLSDDPLPIGPLIEGIDMVGREDHFPSQLSGGQQQRVAIARALSKNPDILLCDEPTGALDFATGIQVLQLLKDFNRQYHKTVMIITHNSSIGQIGDRVFHIKDGLIDRITVNESPKEASEVSW
ncbi:MAG: ABC transporter ATP-binding protein [Lachnospiraceae bacterium]|nr:ABC transporter ATP-binding protein [Lachnospiraceae bacterium]